MIILTTLSSQPLCVDAKAIASIAAAAHGSTLTLRDGKQIECIESWGSLLHRMRALGHGTVVKEES